MSERPIALAKDGAAHLLEEVEAALAAGAIDEAEWYRRVAAWITPRYLAADTPWAQSGRSGDAASFERARSLLADAMLPGTFLDVGCASGYLMECMARWCWTELTTAVGSPSQVARKLRSRTGGWRRCPPRLNARRPT
ncbi:MAG: hypothetical protein H6738_03840 [Alphaproteobacteria bacterium]|nr:hypothetical protein [Alphaproteobacteria bacterium]MCB9695901.1 hypothetical protein [Alphaproteobacteria bacterium]